MYQSRCGVECNACARRKEVSCTGCLEMKVPFWGGQCGVKSCCEGRGLEHCGVCAEFPCEMQKSMGKDMGFDPKPRLQKLRDWAKEV